jgi:regulator of replication initiation timing
MVCQSCREAPKRITELEAEAQRWREAHDKIIAYAADVEEKAKESIAEVAAENATLKNERDRLRKQLAEAKAQMEGEVWNLSQQNTALREALGEQVTEKMRQRMHDAAKREEALNHLAIENAALREDKARLVNIARGCHDYGGGYKDKAESEIYHHGIQTVINSLEAAEQHGTNLQLQVLEMIGAKERAAIDVARKET